MCTTTSPLQFQCVSLQTAKHQDFLQLSLELFNRDCLECTDNVINADLMAMRALSTFCYFKVILLNRHIIITKITPSA